MFILEVFTVALEGSFLVAFGAGILSFLSPCVLPLVPPYLCFLAGVSVGQPGMNGAVAVPAGTTWRTLQVALPFVLGFSTVFVALGATASVLGQAMTSHFSTLSVIAGLVISLLGLHLLGLLRVGILMREARFQAAARPASLFGAYLVGLAFAFGWTPCVGPVLAAILLVAGTEGTAGRGAALLGSYSAGIGIPFLAVALFMGPFLGVLVRYRQNLAVVEKVTGGALVVTGVLIMTGAMSRIADWMLRLFPGFGTIG